MPILTRLRELLKAPKPFNPIQQPEDLVCTHEGSSSCPIDPKDWGAPHYAGVWVPTDKS